PPSTVSLSEGVRTLPAGTGEGLNDWKRTGYGGPAPPIGRHRYFFKLYALDEKLHLAGAPTNLKKHPSHEQCPNGCKAGVVRTVSEMKANNVKARLQETTENDGKPLTISIADGANGLVYSARKAGTFARRRRLGFHRSGH
ncbi:MAG TPA: hypothetical protein VJY15_13000, partial [Candidatus Acidoferrum sp.]|nr:hypothetical protein [Candidatus Acidoferrum sp.]